MNDVITSAVVAGLGDPLARVRVYSANRPPLAAFSDIHTIRPLLADDIARIATETGNHWRKIFNVYAKWLFEWCEAEFCRWQQLRDVCLLQSGSNTSLLFSAPDFSQPALHVVMGRQYAASLSLGQLKWLNDDFAINRKLGVIVCPYFDYRQLSNAKIVRLAELSRELSGGLGWSRA